MSFQPPEGQPVPPGEQPTQPGPQSFPFPTEPFPSSSPSFPSPTQPASYPGYPSQPPGYPPGPPPQWQMPYQPMPPQRSRFPLWIILGVVAVVLVVCVGGIAVYAAGAFATKPNVTNSNPTPTVVRGSTPAVTPTSGTGSGNHRVGETVTYNDHWQITINSVSFYQGDPNQFDPTPATGNTFLVIEGTFKNLQSTNQPLSTLVEFELRDSQGNNYPESFLPSLSPPDGTVPAGGPAHGKWGYEVPTTAQNFTLIFSEDFGQSTVIWDITLG